MQELNRGRLFSATCHVQDLDVAHLERVRDGLALAVQVLVIFETRTPCCVAGRVLLPRHLILVLSVLRTLLILSPRLNLLELAFTLHGEYLVVIFVDFEVERLFVVNEAFQPQELAQLKEVQLVNFGLCELFVLEVAKT